MVLVLPSISILSRDPDLSLRKPRETDPLFEKNDG